MVADWGLGHGHLNILYFYYIADDLEFSAIKQGTFSKKCLKNFKRVSKSLSVTIKAGTKHKFEVSFGFSEIYASHIACVIGFL